MAKKASRRADPRSTYKPHVGIIDESESTEVSGGLDLLATELGYRIGDVLMTIRYRNSFPNSVEKGTIEESERGKFLSYVETFYPEHYNLAQKLGIVDFLPFLVEDENWKDNGKTLQFICGIVGAEDYITTEMETDPDLRRIEHRDINFEDIELLERRILENIGFLYTKLGKSFNRSQSEVKKSIKDKFIDIKKTYALKSALTESGSNQPIENLLVEIYLPNGIGNGILLTEDGYVLTAYHVVDKDNLKGAYARDVHGNKFPVVEIVKKSKTHDLAILRVKRKGECLPTQVSANDISYEIGTEIEWLHLLDGKIYRQIGVIIQDPEGNYRNSFCTSTNIRHGYSGSACLKDGSLIGILTEGRWELPHRKEGNYSIGYGVASKLTPIRKFLDSVLPNGKK